MEKDEIVCFNSEKDIQVDELLVEPFLKIIEHDLNEGKIHNLMQKIANLSESDIENIITPYKDFLSVEEKSFYKCQIKAIRENVLDHLSKEHDVEQNLEEYPSSPFPPIII